MKIIYIRHGRDKKSRYKHDEKLVSEAKEEIYDLAEELLQKYGTPDVIYYSPFYRTYKTAKYLQKAVYQIKSKKKKIKVEPKIGRFFNRREQENPKVRDITYQRGPIIEENIEQFRDRVESQLDATLNSNYKVVWNVTHSLVILHVAKIKNINRDSHVNYLDTLVI